MRRYFFGETVRCTGRFVDGLTGAATDPDGVKFRMRTPTAAAVTYVYGVDAEVVKDSTGVYHFDQAGDAAGGYSYRWSGQDAGGDDIAAFEDRFQVRAQSV